MSPPEVNTIASDDTQARSISDRSKREIEMGVDRFYSVVGIRWEVLYLTGIGSRHDQHIVVLLEDIVVDLFDI